MTGGATDAVPTAVPESCRIDFPHPTIVRERCNKCLLFSYLRCEQPQTRETDHEGQGSAALSDNGLNRLQLPRLLN